MKKKILVFLMTGVMLLTGSTTGLAEEQTEEAAIAAEADKTEVNWADYEEIAAGDQELAGELMPLGETGLFMYVPFAYESSQISDAEKEDGYVALYQTRDKHGIAVMAETLEGFTLDEYTAIIKEDEELYDLEELLLNGMDAVAYSMQDEEGEVKLVSLAVDNTLVTLVFYPVDDQVFAETAELLTASLQEAE